MAKFLEEKGITTLSKPELGNWLHTPVPLANPALRLFAFPYAGATGTVYHSWAKDLPPGIELNGVQLPGRLGRIRERPYTDMGALIEALAEVISCRRDAPFVFFGHSMGAVLGFELARHVLSEDPAAPLIHLIVSGRRAPRLPNPRPGVWRLPDALFMREIRRFSGTPEQVLNDPELMALLLPALRADFQMLDTSPYKPMPRLTVPITALGGRQDSEALEEEVRAWAEETASDFDVRLFDGGHFFIAECRAEVVDLVGRTCVDASMGQGWRQAPISSARTEACSHKALTGE